MNITPDLRIVFDNYARHYLFENGIFKYLIDGEIKSTEINIQKTVKKLGDYEIYQFNSFGKISGGSILRNTLTNDIGIVYGFNCGGEIILSWIGNFESNIELIIQSDIYLASQMHHLLIDLTPLQQILFANQVLVYKDIKQVTSKKASNLILIGLFSLPGMDLFDLPDYRVPVEHYSYFYNNYDGRLFENLDSENKIRFESAFILYLRRWIDSKGFETFILNHDLGQVLGTLRNLCIETYNRNLIDSNRHDLCFPA